VSPHPCQYLPGTKSMGCFILEEARVVVHEALEQTFGCTSVDTVSQVLGTRSVALTLILAMSRRRMRSSKVPRSDSGQLGRAAGRSGRWPLAFRRLGLKGTRWIG
jgi:hypothetical protein